MKRRNFTVFAIKSQPRGLAAVWKIKRKLLIEKKEAVSKSYSWKQLYAKRSSHYRSSRLQMLFKIGVLENFAIFTKKHPYWSLFKIKLQAWKPATLFKRGSDPVFFCEYYEIFKNSLFNRTSQVAASALQIIRENKIFSFLLT